MMSAHDVAVAALNEVASNVLSESQAAETTPKIRDTVNSTDRPETSSKPSQDTVDMQDISEIPSNSSNNSQTTADVSTPPTSEELSSHSQQSQSQLEQLSVLAAAQHPIQTAAVNALPSPSIVATNAGQKRTRDGFTKTSESNSSESPTIIPSGGHSRNRSSVSMASSTASTRELTSELRTRLSYAMVKVNKGWESLPIDEVESLASQAGSPTSSNSTLQGRRHFLTSPRAAIASMQGLREPQHTNTVAPTVSSIDPVLYGNARPSRTYESFWREQHQRQVGPSGTMQQSPGRRSLAPPADIEPADRRGSQYRRTHEKHSKPTMLQGTSDLSQSSNGSGGSTTPLTPSRSHPTDAALQTPTQKSLQEQDAIETLLFMSSPGHSSMGQPFPQPKGQASQLQSPMRAEFGAPLRTGQDRKMESSQLHPGEPVNPNHGRQRTRAIGAGRLRDDQFNQILDSMTESSDEEIEIPITPKRLATNHV